MREHTRALEEQGRALSEAAGQEGETKKTLETLMRQKADADIEVNSTKDRLAKLQEELDKLRRHVHDLQQDSADKEMKLLQMAKQRGEDKEEIRSLNIALEAKQQDLDLVKRRASSRTSVGTPAPAKPGTHRRESSIFTTPTVSRPPSAMSDASSATSAHDRKGSQESISTGPRSISALAKTTRPTNATSSKMGPPAAKPRSSFASTPTPAQRSNLSRSTAAKPSPAVAAAHRRVPSSGAAKSLAPKLAASVSSISESSEAEEKENKTITPRRAPVPA
ncbi:hypothetical protein HDZ31DRAFT_51117 [Schizophyllum fasciatum]